MRTLLLVLVILILAPVGVAATSTWSDPRGDEATFVASGAGAKACRHPATDITQVDIKVEGQKLTVLLAVLNASGGWACGEAVVIPSHSGTQRVVFQTCGESCGSSLTLQRKWTTSLTGERVDEQCFIVDGSIQMGCRPNVPAGDATVWSIPLKTSGYELRGKCFGTTFAESRSSSSVPETAAVFETRDTLTIGASCL